MQRTGSTGLQSRRSPVRCIPGLVGDDLSRSRQASERHGLSVVSSEVCHASIPDLPQFVRNPHVGANHYHPVPTRRLTLVPARRLSNLVGLSATPFLLASASFGTLLTGSCSASATEPFLSRSGCTPGTSARRKLPEAVVVVGERAVSAAWRPATDATPPC